MRLPRTLPLEPIMVALLGGSAAFALWAMPAAMIDGVVPGQGVGATLRLLVALVGGLAAAGLGWSVFALIDRAPAARDRGDDPIEVPAILRRDPAAEATVRRPIFAHTDLGAPAATDRPAPPVPAEDALLLDEGFEIVDSPPAPAELVAEPAPAPAPAPEPAPTPQSAPMPEAPPPVAAAGSPAEEPPLSTSDLMARLEAGLLRRQTGAPAGRPLPKISAETDGALRDALGDLQRIVKNR